MRSPSPAGAQALRFSALVLRADRFRRPAEGGVVALDEHLREQRGDGPPAERVPQALLEQVADHPLALRPEDIERIRRDLPVGLTLQRQQADLAGHCRE